MNAHIEPQIIKQNGHPAFAVIPWNEYQRLLNLAAPESADTWLPHEVVEAVAIDGASLIKAWREYLGLTQADLAEKSGMSQPSLARIEKNGAKPRTTTLKKVAKAMNISSEQLSD
ncbi:MAG: helix-turn-helix transcriptional regulator [Pseudomonadota bacterium]|nr:helix-turn-helix transcriptional regulator [Pseudomonadota bacterium]